MVVLSVDSGYSGGYCIAEIGCLGSISIKETGTLKFSSNRLDFIFKKHYRINTSFDAVDHCIIERQHAFPRDTPCTAFSVGVSYASIYHIVKTSFTDNIEFVDVNHWQSILRGVMGVKKRDVFASKELPNALCDRVFSAGKVDLYAKKRLNRHTGIIDAIAMLTCFMCLK